MTDPINTLNGLRLLADGGLFDSDSLQEICRSGVAEIERLTAENERLRTTLQDCRMFFDATGRDLHVMKIDAALGRHEQ